MAKHAVPEPIRARRGSAPVAASSDAPRADLPLASAPALRVSIGDIAVLPPGAGPIQRAALPNRTGLPDRLKAGMEALSGLSMDDVRVHRNSPRPARMGAAAYAQSSAIHLAPGAERHLPHEAWHVVQQRQGRVRPTGTVAGQPLNEDISLETEADRMGAKAVSLHPAAAAPPAASLPAVPAPAVQLSRGSSKANEDLKKAMGKSGSRVDKQPKAKPHTKTGTGSSGTDHQARNANVINKAKQDTRFAHQDPTMFSASRMRSDDRAVEKDKAANEERTEKKKASKASKEDQIREMFGLGPDEEITKDHRSAFTQLSEL